MFLRIRSCVATYTQVVKRHAPAHVPHFGKVKYRQWNCINENANKYKSDVGNQGSNQWHQNQGFSPTVLEIKYIFRLGRNIITILLYRRVLRQSSRKSQPVLYQQNPCTTNTCWFPWWLRNELLGGYDDFCILNDCIQLNLHISYAIRCLYFVELHWPQNWWIQRRKSQVLL